MIGVIGPNLPIPLLGFGQPAGLVQLHGFFKRFLHGRWDHPMLIVGKAKEVASTVEKSCCSTRATNAPLIKAVYSRPGPSLHQVADTTRQSRSFPASLPAGSTLLRRLPRQSLLLRKLRQPDAKLVKENQ